MKRSTALFVLPLCAVAALLGLLRGGTVWAAPAAIIVTTTTDEVANNAQCSLREAITAANTDSAFDGCAAGAGADTIVLPAGVYVLTITGTGEINNANGDLDVFSTLVISGAGAGVTFIEAGPTFNEGLLHVHAGGDPAQRVTLLGVTLRNSHAGVAALWNNSPDLVISASAILSSSGTFAGAIHNQGDALNIVNSRLAGNSSASGPGALYDVGLVVTLTKSLVDGNNSATAVGGLYSQGSIRVLSSTLAGNAGKTAGGLYVSSAPHLVAGSVITANRALSYGGGLNNTFGELTVSQTLIVSNSAPLGGGLANSGVMHVLSSQILSNTAFGGGGIGNAFLLDVHDSRIAYNRALSLGGGIGNDGGTHYSPFLIGQAALENTLVEYNSAPEGAGIGQAGVLTLTKGTLQYNSASSRGGGLGIGNGFTVVSGTHILSNSAPAGAGVYHTWEAQYGNLGATLNFTGTVIQGNSTGGLTVITGTLFVQNNSLSSNAPNCAFGGGFVMSSGGNSSSDQSCAAKFTGPGDVNGLLLLKLFLPLIVR